MGAAGGGGTVIVVPCFDEAGRLDTALLGELDDAGLGLVLVDDGSTDRTVSMLEQWAAGREAVTVLALGHNAGKGEAVRAGLLAAVARGADWVGFVDADFATRPSEVLRLVDIAQRRDAIDVVLGARVAMLGRDITRSPFRHYTGRVFATGASIVLGLPVYDSQCGAKLFRCTAALSSALSAPFSSRWGFDVELIGRLVRSGTPTDAFREEPLEQWHDIGGSRRTIRSSVRSCVELVRIRARLRRWP